MNESQMVGQLDPTDELDIHTLFARMVEGWNQGNGDAMAAAFTEHADYIVATGQHLHGRREIASVHQHLFDGFFQGTRLAPLQILGMRYIRPDVMLVHSTGSVLMPGEDENRVAPNGLTSVLLTRDNGAWEIAAFQNTPTGHLRTIRFFWRWITARLRNRR